MSSPPPPGPASAPPMFPSSLSTFPASFMAGYDWSRRDPRVDQWFFMSSIWPSFLVSCLYLYIAKIGGQAFMKNRQPYSLKGLIMFYNVVQMIGNIWLLQGYLKHGWLTEYNWICDPLDRDPSLTGSGVGMATVCWWAYMIRFLDFFDTFFFILRKKFDHVNALQVIHHFLMPCYGWIIVRYTPGGQESFGPMFNSLIHFIMYFYYFMAACGPQFQKYLWWKRYLTTFQIIQFVVVFFKDLIVLLGFAKCDYPWQTLLLTVLMMTLMFVLFVQFYIATYTKKRQTKPGSSDGERKKV